MTHALSILISTFNDECLKLVIALQRQATDIVGLDFEILVGDDGSTNAEVVSANTAINRLDNCSYLRNKQNRGRAAIRNFLASKARHPWLLFIDGDMKVERDNFIRDYLRATDSDTALVIYGGYALPQLQLKGNLRYKYEQNCQPNHTLAMRRKNTYKDFHTSNFMVRRDVMISHPLDENFRNYGYEDVLWGKQLCEQGIPLLHIDNPVNFEDFEDNPSFVRKTEEGLNTLYLFSDRLEDYSRLIPIARKLGFMQEPVRAVFGALRSLLRRQLCSEHPSLTVFKFYKLGYYLSLNS